MILSSAEAILAKYRVPKSSPVDTSTATPLIETSLPINLTGRSGNAPQSMRVFTPAPTASSGPRSSNGWVTAIGLSQVLWLILAALIFLNGQSRLDRATARGDQALSQLQAARLSVNQLTASLADERRQLETATRELETARRVWSQHVMHPTPPECEDLTGQRYEIQNWPHPEIIGIGPDRLVRLQPVPR